MVLQVRHLDISIFKFKEYFIILFIFSGLNPMHKMAARAA